MTIHNNWIKYYNDRIISVEKAVELIKSNDRVVLGHGLGKPEIFIKPLLERADKLQDVILLRGFDFGSEEYCDPKYSDSFKIHSVFLNNADRIAYWEGRIEYYPIPFSQQDKFFTEMQPEVSFAQVTPPNEDGYVSLGISVDYTRATVDSAKTVIVQVNKNMPWTDGDSVVHVSQIDYFVEQDTPITELAVSEVLSETDMKIAQNVTSLINDGETLQIGVGAVPDKVMQLLGNHKHMGIHSEMGSVGLMRLMQKGVIDNSKKTLDQGYSVFTFLGGNKEFYDFVNHNPQIKMKQSSYVTSPLIVSRQKNMSCINSAIQVDLFGQVVADMIGKKQYSGVGGQLDFMRGAQMSEGGKSVICMPSTAAKGKVSRIVASLSEGAAVTDSRFDSMYVVTEYGIANLVGKSVAQRAKELIKIAHPDFREDLEREFETKIRRII